MKGGGGQCFEGKGVAREGVGWDGVKAGFAQIILGDFPLDTSLPLLELIKLSAKLLGSELMNA